MKNLDKTLTLSKEEMKTLGYKAVDMVVDYIENIKNQRVGNVIPREKLEPIFNEPIPMIGKNPDEILDFLKTNVFLNNSHVDHPRFFAFVPGPGNYVSAVADFLASGFNVFCGNWLESSAASEIEIVTINWLLDLCGFPRNSGGIFVSGGSKANLTALIVARDVHLHGNLSNATVYFSSETHSSVKKGLKIIGLTENNFREIKSDKNFCLSINELINQIEIDKKNNKIPFCVIGNAGTTSTGSIDPLVEISQICKKENLWFHVDGAYGAPAIISKNGKALLKGLELVDSLAIDPHKWLFQPYEIGCVLIKDPTKMRESFHVSPDYLKDTELGEINFFDYGVQLSRGFRALKLWMSLKIFGLNLFKEAIDHGFYLADCANEWLKENNEFEIISHSKLSIVAFRFYNKNFSDSELDELNKKIIESLINDGFAMISSTILNGKTCLRMCTINPRTTKEDIIQTLEKIKSFAKELSNCKI